MEKITNKATILLKALHTKGWEGLKKFPKKERADLMSELLENSLLNNDGSVSEKGLKYLESLKNFNPLVDKPSKTLEQWLEE